MHEMNTPNVLEKCSTSYSFSFHIFLIDIQYLSFFFLFLQTAQPASLPDGDVSTTSPRNYTSYPSWFGMVESRHWAEPAPWHYGCVHANATAGSVCARARLSWPLRVSVRGLWLPSSCASSSCWVSWDRSFGDGSRREAPRAKCPAAMDQGSIEGSGKMAGLDEVKAGSRKTHIQSPVEFRMTFVWLLAKRTEWKRETKCQRTTEK